MDNYILSKISRLTILFRVGSMSYVLFNGEINGFTTLNNKLLLAGQASHISAHYNRNMMATLTYRGQVF
jgi:hypothetical protein